MCRLQNIAIRDYQESVTTGQIVTQTNGQKDPYVLLCFAGNTENGIGLSSYSISASTMRFHFAIRYK